MSTADRPLRLLVLAARPDDVAKIRVALDKAGLASEIRPVAHREAFTAALQEDGVDMVLADDQLPGFDATAALALTRTLRPDVPFIVVSGTSGEDHAVEMLQAGATDHVLKDRLGRLGPAVVRAQREAEERAARRKAEEAMLLQREMLLRHRQVEAIGSLVAGVAHELNNPLALLVGHATLLRRKAGEGPLAERADKITAAADRCARIVRNFVALARRYPPERKPLDLARLVPEVLEVLAYTLRVEGIEVEVAVQKDLPQPLGDVDSIRQMLVNLVVNAQQAMRPATGTRRLKVAVEMDPAQSCIRIVVADNGPGVPEDLRERIFDPFFSTRPAGEGTGMGLPLCRGIAVDHGGEVRLDSPPEGGARFVAELPLTPPSPVLAVVTPSTPSPGSRSILVVDDEPDLAALMGDALEQAGHTAQTAATGALALERLGERSYDLVLCDMRMPDMDGSQLYEEVQRRYPKLRGRFVFVTGDTLAPGTATFIQRVGAPVVNKPFEIEELVRTVNRALRGPGEG